MRISDGSSDVCSAELLGRDRADLDLGIDQAGTTAPPATPPGPVTHRGPGPGDVERPRHKERGKWAHRDRKSVGSGKRVPVRIGPGGRGNITTNNKTEKYVRTNQTTN